MDYEVRLVDDELVPVDAGWLFVAVEEGTFLFIKRSLATSESALCRTLSRAWCSWQACMEQPQYA